MGIGSRAPETSRPKRRAIKKYGIATGIGMGDGTYSVMPVPYKLAFVWFNGTVVEALIAGLMTALIVRE